MAYLLAVVAASAIFIVAGWRSRNARRLAAVQGRYGLPTDPLWADAEIDVDASQADAPNADAPIADAGAAVRLALKRLAPVMASQSVRAEVATHSELKVRMRGAALTDLIEELLTAAIHGAPASRLLLTAATRGDLVCIGVTDDMPGADCAQRLGSVRGLIERIALRGGVLDVKVRPAEGTTMTLLLRGATQEPAAPEEQPDPDRFPAEPERAVSASP